MSSLPHSQSLPRYRQVLRRELPEHYLRPDNLHLLWLIPHVAIVAGGLWAMSAWFSWWTAPFIGLAIGHSVGCMGFIGHEVCHGGAIKNRKLRHLIAGVAFSPFGIGPYLWSRWHNADHHGHTQHRALDPDRLFVLDEYKQNPILRSLYRLSPVARNVVVFSFFSVMMTVHNVFVMVEYLRSPKSTARDRAVILFQFLLPKTLWIVCTVLLGWEVLLLGYLAPLLVANALVISYIATNHFLNPLADESDVLASSLSVTLPRWLRWLDVLHSNFGAHVAHHLFPQAPSRYARKIEKHIAEIWPERFHSMPLGRALKLLWRTEWVYDEQGTSLIDPQQGTATPTLGNGL